MNGSRRWVSHHRQTPQRVPITLAASWIQMLSSMGISHIQLPVIKNVGRKAMLPKFPAFKFLSEFWSGKFLFGFTQPELSFISARKWECLFKMCVSRLYLALIMHFHGGSRAVSQTSFPWFIFKLSETVLCWGVGCGEWFLWLIPRLATFPNH